LFVGYWTCLILAGALAVSAAGVNPWPTAESFEDYPAGMAISQAPGWTVGAPPDALLGQVGTNAAALLALAAYTNAGGTLPLATTHGKLLGVAGPVAQAVAGPTGGVVRADLLVLPFRRDEAPPADPTLHASIGFDVGGRPTILHRDLLTGSNVWQTLTGAPAVATGSWVRLTVTLDYDHRFYQISLDGSAPIEDAVGWSGHPPGGMQPGPWFAMPATEGSLSEVLFNGGGEAYVDDVVIGGDLPIAQTHPPEGIAVGQATLNGFLTSTGMAPASVEVYWGPADGGTSTTAWATNRVWGAPQAPGAFQQALSGLPAEVFYYRFAAVNAFGRHWADATELFFPANVSVVPAHTPARERPPEAGIFRIERAGGATNGVTAVPIAVGGTATAGSDYVALTNATVTIPAGVSFVEVAVTPIRDEEVEPDETVVLTIGAGRYAIGVAQATVTIVDSPVVDLLWDNGTGDRNWNTTSANWFIGQVFYPRDRVTFNAEGEGRIYVGTATWNPGPETWTEQTPADAEIGRMTVRNGTFQFEGGAVTGGPVEIQGGTTVSRVIDRNLNREAFGTGAIVLRGNGEFWRQVPPDDQFRLQTLGNALVVAGTNTLQGGRGVNRWAGALALHGRLYIGYTNAVVNHENRFAGVLTLDQTATNPAPRVVALRTGGGRAFLDGPIVDSPETNGAGAFPLVLETATNSAVLTILGTNSYAHGTVVTNVWGTNGVVVAAGANLGNGWVRVEGFGARLRVEGAAGIRGPLTVGTNAVVTLAADGAVQGANSRVTVTNGGLLVLESGDCLPDEGILDLGLAGRVQIGTNLTETVGDLYIGGERQRGGLYTRDDWPANIVGGGAIRVRGATPPGVMLIVR
jgi:hypothetical protein